MNRAVRDRCGGWTRYWKLAACLTMATAGAVAADAQWPSLYHAVPIAPFDKTEYCCPRPLAMNDLGQTVGHILSVANGSTLPMYWDPKVGVRILEGWLGSGAEGVGINNGGHAAIEGKSAGSFTAYSYLWGPEIGMVNIGDLPGGWQVTRAFAINNRDQIVGYSYGDLPFEPKQQVLNMAFFWDPVEGMTLIGDFPGGNWTSTAHAINDHGVVTGVATSKCLEAFIWDRQRGLRSLGKTPQGKCITWAEDINNYNQIVGAAPSPGSALGEAFVWSEAEGVKFIGYAPGGALPFSQATAINDHGGVLGYGFYDKANPLTDDYKFLWDPIQGFRIWDETFLDAASKEMEIEADIYDTNNRWQLTGFGLKATRYRLDPVLLGDMNCDDKVDFKDIPVMIEKVQKYAQVRDPPLYDGEECGWWFGDLNQDGRLDESDVAPFLELLFAKKAVD